MTAPSLVEFQSLVVGRFEQTGHLSIEILHDLSDQTGASIHLAVMAGPYLEYILSGRKTIESRITKNRMAPYGMIDKGDFILFKQSSGPVRAVGLVKDVLSNKIENIDELKSFTEPFTKGLAYDHGYLEDKVGAKYCTLVFIDSVLSTPDIPVSKRGRHTWLVI